MALSRKLLGKLVVAKTTDEMSSIAANHRFLTDGRIDLTGARIRFDHEGLDLTRFLFQDSDISGSNLVNCHGEKVSFAGCQLKRVRISAEKGARSSFSGCSFEGATIERSYFGPRTVDFSRSTFRTASIIDTTFMLASLSGADFSDSRLKDVLLRGAVLEGASFCGARLERVCLEKANLRRADFTDAAFVQMEHWGEPDFADATISDDLRYQYGIVADPVAKINQIVELGDFSESESEEIRRFQDYIFGFAASAPEVMLIGSEYEGTISIELFCRLMKLMKDLQQQPG